MKVKQLLLLSLLPLSIIGCDDEVEATRHHLTIKGSSDVCVDLPFEGNYKVGQKLDFKIKHVTDVSFYAYLNNERLEPSKDDENYSYYTFRMPNKDSELGIGNRYYVDREYSIREILYVDYFEKEDVTMVEIETGDVAGRLQPTITQSNDQRDIDYNYDIINAKQMVKTTIAVMDGVYLKVKFYFGNTENTVEYRIDNEIAVSLDFMDRTHFAYKSGASKPKIEHPIVAVEE